ncbi:MAG: DUF362 domain-containing protein [Anaerolineales bacterium]|nr:DUF362 domain-containing protein [Anaerolineales bacterium]
MNKISRRGFLRFLAAGLSFLGLSSLLGCKEGEKAISKSFSEGGKSAKLPSATATNPSTPTDLPTATVPEPTSTWTPKPTSVPPHIAVARNGDPETMVRKALAALGGMERFVKQGDDVIIKPNICVGYHTYEYAATTNPWVVGALVKLALGAGARRVRVMDYPFGGPAPQAYAKSGIQKQVRAAGGKMEVMSGFKFVKTNIEKGKSLKSCRIYDEVLKADVLINVPIAKHHGMAHLTLGMKNLMGVIYNRPQIHNNYGQRLADLNSRVRSDLVVVDAVRMLLRNGPSGGNLGDVRKADTVIASPDVVAADSYAATLFNVEPNGLRYVRAGSEMGLGRSDLGNLKIEEINVG